MILCNHEHEGDCCFRRDIRCTILNGSNFVDSKCHFRKEYENGPNLYDLERKRAAKKLLRQILKNEGGD